MAGASLRGLLAASAADNLALGAASVALPLYAYAIGLGALAAGVLLTVVQAASIAFSIPAGLWADSRGRAEPLAAGQAMLAAGFLIAAASRDMRPLLLAAALLGAGQAPLSTAGSAIFADMTPPEGRSSAYSALNFVGTMAYGTGSLLPYLASLLVRGLALYYYLFVVDFAASLPPLALYLSMGRMRPARSARLRWPRRSSRVIALFSVNSALGLGAGMLIPLLPLWFKLRYGISVAQISWIFSAMNYLTGASYLAAPALARRLGYVRSIAATEAASVALMALAPLSPTYGLAGALLIARNVLMNVSGPVQTALQTRLLDQEELAIGLALISLEFSLPWSLGPTLGGWMMEEGMLDAPFYAAAALYSASIAAFYLAFSGLEPGRAGPS